MAVRKRRLTVSDVWADEGNRGLVLLSFSSWQTGSSCAWSGKRSLLYNCTTAVVLYCCDNYRLDNTSVQVDSTSCTYIE